MPSTTWNSTFIDGIEYWVIDTAKFRIPKNWDPTSNMFIAIGVPDGGVGFFEAIAQGDDGATPNLDSVINFTPLAPGDPTADFASFTETSPNLYRLNLGLHTGQDGTPGTAVLDPDSFGTPVYKKIITVNATADGFEYQSQKVGDWYWPGTILNTPSGQPGFTLCSIGIPAQDFDWRPTVTGQCVFTGTGSDLRVDLIARLGPSETGGNIVGRGIGSPELSATTHIHPTTALIAGPPFGSADSYDRVSQGIAATIYLRAERQTGTETFTTSNTDTTFRVKVDPIP